MKFDLWQAKREQAEVVACGLKILRCGTDDCPELYIWRPKATNPYIKYYYHSKEEREKRVLAEIESYERHLKYKAEQKKAEREKPLPEVHKGDIYYTSWGYDQTNYDFIIVEKVSPSGKSCICRTVTVKTIGASGQSDIVIPTSEGASKTFRMKITGNGMRGSYYYCQNSKRFDYFSKHTVENKYYPTNPMFGH